MTVQQFCDAGDLQVLCAGDAMDREITGCYCGTVMGNVNAIGVAALADTACIVLTESAAFDDAARARAEQNGITVLQTEKNTYETAVLLSGLLRS